MIGEDNIQVTDERWMCNSGNEETGVVVYDGGQSCLIQLNIVHSQSFLMYNREIFPWYNCLVIHIFARRYIGSCF